MTEIVNNILTNGKEAERVVTLGNLHVVDETTYSACQRMNTVQV